MLLQSPYLAQVLTAVLALSTARALAVMGAQAPCQVDPVGVRMSLQL